MCVCEGRRVEGRVTRSVRSGRRVTRSIRSGRRERGAPRVADVMPTIDEASERGKERADRARRRQRVLKGAPRSGRKGASGGESVEEGLCVCVKGGESKEVCVKGGESKPVPTRHTLPRHACVPGAQSRTERCNNSVVESFIIYSSSSLVYSRPDNIDRWPVTGATTARQRASLSPIRSGASIVTVQKTNVSIV